MQPFSAARERWERVKQLFHEALEQPAGERAAWLGQRCGSDTAMRTEVERLLAAHLAAGSFIEAPAADLHGRADAVHAARCGSTMGRYRLNALIGVGGMGEVYEAVDADLDRTVAIKVVGHDEAHAHERLIREARNASRLNHPNICTIHHVGDTDGRPYIVMELVEGQLLSDLIPADGMPVETIVEYGTQVLGALAHAHGRGVIHRDLKSANLMVKPDGQVKLLDFGLARHLAAPPLGASGLSTHSVELTAAGGTLPYMAPEVLRGETADARSDIWAFGVLLYEMATGALPFAGATAEKMREAIIAGHASALPPTVPPGLASLIFDCLRKEPSERPGDVAALRARLDSLRDSPRPATESPARISGELPSQPQRPRARRRWLSLAMVVTALVAVSVIAWGWKHSWAASDRPAIRGLAVLPLENLSGDLSQDYFADGITEALITELGRTSRLRVVSRTTAMRYRGARKSLSDVARDLRVDALIEGSVTRNGNRVRVAARLFERGDTQIWTGTYERPAREVLALQRDLVRTIARELRVSIAGDDDMSLARAVEPGVYESYLKGRYYWNKRTQASLATAVEQFSAAKQQDPTFAPAYVGLADCYNQMGTVMVGSGSPAAMRPRAVAAAIAALQIDPALGEAHAALAYTRHYDWQWDEAEREFRRALQLGPNNALAHLWYANYLMSLGRMDQAVAEVERARELDPLSLVVLSNVGWTLQWAGRPAEAVNVLRDALALDPNYIQAHSRLAGAYVALSRFDEAIAQYQAAERIAGPDLIGLSSTYAESGRRREAEALLHRVLEIAARQYFPPYALAQPYVQLGDADHTFEWLERAYQERSNGIAYLAVDPIWRPIRADARYQRLLERVGLKPFDDRQKIAKR